MNKFKELLEQHRGLAEKIHKDTKVRKASITKYKSWEVTPNFENKLKIYEFLLDYRLINPEETSIEQLFNS